MKAVWKLNSAFKHFTSIYKAVFPSDISSTASVSSIIADLNHRYTTSQLSHAMKLASIEKQQQEKATSSGWGFRLRGASVPAKTQSAADLQALNSGKSTRSRMSSLTSSSNKHEASANTAAGGGGGVNGSAISLPNSAGSSLRVITPPNDELEQNSNEIVSNSFPKPEWTQNPITSFVVSGGAFGHAIFELVFALMPPKARKMFSWLGYGSGDRKKALKVGRCFTLQRPSLQNEGCWRLISYLVSLV